MTQEISPPQLLNKLQLPALDLATLSFASTNKASSVKAWAEALPATRITHTGIQLYKALPEIARLQTTADNRLAMLEAIRPYVHHCIQGLAKGFLNQPLILPEGPLKTAVVAQALQKHMSKAYMAVLVEQANKSKKGKAVEAQLELSCHRAITGLGLLLLRGYQLYRQIPNNLWLELHSIYRLAEYFELTNKPIKDPLLETNSANTINQAYTRILLLACAQPNQLRQIEVSATYEALEFWAHLAKLQTVDNQKPDNLFIVNLSADMAPLYKSRFSGNSQDDSREIDMAPLLHTLRKQREQKETEQPLLHIPSTLSVSLLDHLERAWSITQQRAFERQPGKGTIEVAVGLSNIHHHIINGMPMEEFLGEAEEDEEIEEIDFGAFGTANDPWGTNTSKTEETDDHPTHMVQIIDTSPGGFCLEWRDQIPAQVRAGEAIGLKEHGRHRWGLGVIRWVQQRNQTTRLGVQLLAPKVTPYAAAIEQAMGGFGDYLRILELPSLKAANQPATLVTAYAPFQEMQRVRLISFGEASEAQLNRRILSTGAISQFTFRDLGVSNAPTSNTAAQSEQPEEDYNAVWDD